MLHDPAHVPPDDTVPAGGAPGAPPWAPTSHRSAEGLRTAATELRTQVAAVAERLRSLSAYDRDDVWQGAVADRSRLARAEATRRLSSPTSGALAALVDAASRLDARAAAQDVAAPPGSPCELIDLLRDRWSPSPRCP